MTWKDKLEIGLKDDAPFRRDNLPRFQKPSRGPRRKSDDPTRSPEVPAARVEAEQAPNPEAGRGRARTRPKSAARK